MTTLHLPDQVARALDAQAKARGLSLDEFLKRIAEGMPIEVPEVDLESLSPEGAVRHFDAVMEELYAGDPGGGVRPPDGMTYSREDIYFDHD